MICEKCGREFETRKGRFCGGCLPVENVIDSLMDWLNKNRPNLSPYACHETKRYFRIINNHRGAHCFVAKEAFENKTVGKICAGDLLMPKSYDQPAKHARGDLFDESTWDSAFGPWGMRLLDGWK